MTASPDTLPGLTSAEVADRVRRGLTNKYQPRTSRTYRQILFDNLFNIFNLTLAALLGLMLALGKAGDTLFAGGSVVANIVIGLFQEFRAKRALDKLAALSAGAVRVRRDGQSLDIPVDQVVQDDLIEVTPGDRIVVDGACVWEDAVEVDESLITGESDSIDKSVGDRMTSGSFVTAGRALMRAEQIGAESFVNRLGQTAKGFKLLLTPIQQKIYAIVGLSVVGMALFGPLLAVSGLTNGLPLGETVSNTVVLVTTFVPQGVVLATTLALTFGAVRISLQKTLVQRINAVESMANVTVLCFDKTGTLTHNRLAVTEIIPLGAHTLEQARALLSQYVCCLATQNKTASAIEAFVGRSSGWPEKVAEVSFTSTRKWGAATFADGHTLVLGAPEMLIEDAPVRERASSLAQNGLRVLSFAWSASALNDSQLPAAREPVALIVLSDTPREDIRHTLESFTARGIRLKVISGDNAETVAAIARAAGMHVTGVMTGLELEALGAAGFDKTVQTANIFARITPETKRRIIAALAAQGEYVAMVGDGVNDVPALKAARLGIAMYDGAQIAKDVADLVLLNNALSTLPQALYEGHKTTQKIYSTAKMFLARNMYMILMFIMIGFMGLPFPGQVRPLSWAAISTTSLPALFVTFDLLRPRPIRDFRRQVLGYIIITGLIGAVALTLAYTVTYLVSNRDLALAQSVMTIMASIYGILIFWDVHGVVPYEPITFKQNPREATIGIGIALVTLAVPVLFRDFFQIAIVPLPYWIGLAALTAVVTFALWRSTFEQAKLLAPLHILMTK
ncbi:MAG TPA: HAD-IC family P-type ATPase [Anaerolineae bacterium]|nr:HAD-IC family P-type ATPase [Anaerolineae bacterium]